MDYNLTTLEDDLQRVIFQLTNSKEFMFYGLFLAEINKTFMDHPQIQTACLAKHPMGRIPQMIINPRFWNSLTLPEKKYLILHEVNFGLLVW